MELLFAVLGGILTGLFAQVVVPGHVTRGIALAPAVGGVVAAVLFEALTWAHWSYGSPWIWLVTLVVAGVAALLAAWLVARRRDRADQALFERIRSGAAG